MGAGGAGDDAGGADVLDVGAGTAVAGATDVDGAAPELHAPTHTAVTATTIAQRVLRRRSTTATVPGG